MCWQVANGDGRIFFGIKYKKANAQINAKYIRSIQIQITNRENSMPFFPLNAKVLLQKYGKKHRVKHQKIHIEQMFCLCLPHTHTKKKGKRTKNTKLRLIDTHPIKIKYQNYTRTHSTGCFLLSVVFVVKWLPYWWCSYYCRGDDDNDDEKRSRVLFIIIFRRKSVLQFNFG